MEFTYEIYRYIFYGGAILSALMLIVSVLLFILLKIPKVIGDLTGATARKAIENIRNQNEGSGDKTYSTSHVNKERGKLTDKISPSGRLIKNPSGGIHGAMATQKIGTDILSEQASASETVVLDQSGATTVLGEEMPMMEAGNETTVLSQQPMQQVPVFEIEYDITYIHTNEVIQ